MNKEVIINECFVHRQFAFTQFDTSWYVSDKNNNVVAEFPDTEYNTAYENACEFAKNHEH
jgi:hypothetical protein